MEELLAVLTALMVRFGIPIAVLTLIGLAYSRAHARHVHCDPPSSQRRSSASFVF